MAYGATEERVPARGFGGIEAANIYIVNVLGRFARGFSTVQRGIFDSDQFRKNLGGFNSSYMSPYVVKTFLDTLFTQLKGKVELRLGGYVASDATQASFIIQDNNGTPQTLFTAKCSKKNDADKSAFGNNVALKTEIVEQLKYTLASDMATNGTTAVLTSVENLKVGYKLHLDDGVNSVDRQITSIDIVTKTVTFAAVGVGVTFTAALTTIYRLDWKLTIATKREKGNIEIEETWIRPMFKGNTDGMALATNDVNDGSYYLSLEYNASNTSPEGSDRPAVYSSWQFLTGGSDGAVAPNDATWNTLVSKFADDRAAFLLAPESTSITHNLNMATYASNGQKFVYYAGIPTGATADTLTNIGASLRSVVQFGMIPFDKRFKTIDPVNDEKLEVPNIGYLAAHWFNYFSQYSENKVAAGFDIPINTTDEVIDNGIRHNDSAGVGERLITKYSVNIGAKTTNGIFVNSARTLSSDPGYQWQHQLMIFLIDRNTAHELDLKFEQAVGGNENQVRRAGIFRAYLRARFDAGIYYNGFLPNGKRAQFDNVIILQLDSTNNPLAQLLTGTEVMFYQFIAPYVVENPNLQIASAPLTFVAA